MRLIFIFLILLVFSNMRCFSQDYYDFINAIQQQSPSSGKVTIFQDNSISEVFNKHLLESRNAEGNMGFRVKIDAKSTSLHPNAMEIINEQKAKFLRIFPDVSTYITYEAPDFKLYVGDFRTQSEALKIKNRLNNIFPGAFVVSQPIILPELKK